MREIISHLTFQPQVWFLLGTYNAGEKRGSVIYKKVMEGKQPCRRIKGEKGEGE